MKILAIVGSPRVNGNTSYLVDRALEEAQRAGVDTEKIILSQYKIGPCQGHQNCNTFDRCLQKDDGMMVLEKFRDADGLILASPVYYYDVTAQMKTFVDRNYFLYRHGIKSHARTVGMIVVAGGAGFEDAIRTLKRLALASVERVARENRFIITGLASAPGDVKKNTEFVKQAGDMGRQMAQCLLG